MKNLSLLVVALVSMFTLITDSEARWYDPENGRFLSEDPVGYEGGDVNLYAYVGNNPVNRFDPSGLTWSSNLGFLYDWATGGGSSNRFYGPNTVETQEMQNSPGAAALRNTFNAGGGKSQYSLSYGTGQAAWDTVANPSTADWSSTAAQVGGFAGASAINNGNGTVTFTVTNVAGANSFFYHAVPNRSGSSGPMRNITQSFQWTEPMQCK